jgi:pSer/pThr/pTyr-binding forkhead associated (FHA) protein
MADRVIRLTVQTGPHKGQRFCFRGVTSCEVGRDPDCFIRLTGTKRDRRISRHHCLLCFDPPLVRVQDLGSLNGTFINGRDTCECAADQDFNVLFEDAEPIANVRSGDIITIGGTSFQVDVVSCPPDIPESIPYQPLWKFGESAKKNCPVPCQFSQVDRQK